MIKTIVLLLLTLNVIASEGEKIFIVEFQSEPLAINHGKNIHSKQADSAIHQLESQHDEFINLLNLKFKSSKSKKESLHHYFYAINGIALALTSKQANWVKKQPYVKSIQQEKMYQLQTDIGPSWIGADSVWDGLALDTPGNKGEGVTIAIIDSGINTSHPSFQDVSEAGTQNEYIFPLFDTRYGLCDTQDCNNKLVGIYDFTNENTNGIDSVGHGSHVAGIAAGNFYSINYLGINFRVSGVAPHARIISYKACFFSESSAGGSCSSSALIRAIDQATADQVDVINYSIGSDQPCSPWGGLDSNGDWCGRFSIGLGAKAMLNARSAGVLTIVSAGNNGPGKSTVSYPAIAPWVVAAANSTHSRQLESSVVDFTGGVSDLEDLDGASATSGIGPLKIVHAKDFGNALCGQGNAELKSKCSGTGDDVLTGVSNPFAANTFHGEIVVCDRGSYGRVEKGFNVKQAGAAGYILANTVGQQESIVADNHCLPATHLGAKAGDKLREWLDSGSNHRGKITGQTLVYAAEIGDIMNVSSSRGPTEIIYNKRNSSNAVRVEQSYMKPNVSAPGTSIFSADRTGAGLTTKTGTSMSAPHITGAVALLKSAHPNYFPSRIVSSLVLTAENRFMLKEDKATKANFADQGAGRVKIEKAIGNSLYFDVSRQDFLDANPQNGADIKTLNLPELVDNNCYPTCDFIRKVRKLSSFNVVNPMWTVSAENTNGLNISISPSNFDFENTDEVVLNIHIDATDDNVLGGWNEAELQFNVSSSTGSDPFLDSLSPSVSKMPIAVFVPAGDYPLQVEKTVTTRHGQFNIDLSNLSSMTEARFVGLGFKIPSVSESTLSADNNTSIFDNDGIYEETGSSFQIVEVPSEKLVMIVESFSQNTGVDLYIGKDLNVNAAPDEYELICESKGFATNKRCLLKDVKPGLYWVIINNRRSNQISTVKTEISLFDLNDKAQKAQLSPEIIPGNGMYVKAPTNIASDTALEVFYELPVKSSESDHYYGVIAVGANSNSVGKTAIIPIKIVAQNTTDQKLYALNNEIVEVALDQNLSFSNMYIDTGISATEISLISIPESFTVSFYQTSLDFDPLNIKPDLTSLTPVAVISSLPENSVETVHFDVSSYAPSRWFVKLDTNNATHESTALQAVVEYDENNLIQPNQSLWYNPLRSGWGIDLSLTNSSQSITWYRYNQDGTKPTWYFSNGFQETKNQWFAPLKVVTKINGGIRQEEIGQVSMVYLSNNKGVVTFSMPDKTYSEPISSLYSPGQNCPEVNPNEPLDITGIWYLPQNSGFGNTVIATEQIESTVFYFYDETGLPTWAIGKRNYDETITDMEQVSNGFCPDCVLTQIVKTKIGTITNSYNDDFTGNTTADLSLISPLSGHWQSNGVSQKINTNFGCIKTTKH